MLLTALLGAALCVLLIGCTNLANLLLARALARRKELAVRTAMGAGRERLVRQLLTESLLLAIAGGAAGVMLAFAALPLLVRLVPNSLPIAEAPVIDARVLLSAACITVPHRSGIRRIARPARLRRRSHRIARRRARWRRRPPRTPPLRARDRRNRRHRGSAGHFRFVDPRSLAIAEYRSWLPIRRCTHPAHRAPHAQV